MAAPRKFPDEVRARAVRLVFDVEEEAGSISGACRRIGEQLGINPDTLRGWVKQAQIDAGVRPGMSTPEQHGSSSWRKRNLDPSARAQLLPANADAVVRFAKLSYRSACRTA